MRMSIAQAAQAACLLEVSAPKPGNVSRQCDFTDLRYEDFLLSALAIGPAMESAGRQSLGQTILTAIQDTRRMVQTNTNLGIVLLLAPLARELARLPDSSGRNSAEPVNLDKLRKSLARSLSELTVEDAQKAFAAIRLAQAGWMGRVSQGDVFEEPTISLFQAMALAQERDSIAREYTSGFEVTFETGYKALKYAYPLTGDFSLAIVQAYLTILAHVPDTLIGRKRGMEKAAEVSSWAAETLRLGGVLTTEGRESLARLDVALRDERHTLNPGATADLTAAALFLFLYCQPEP